MSRTRAALASWVLGALVIAATASAAPAPAPASGTSAAAPTASQGPPLNIAADNVVGSHEPEGDIVLLHGHVKITRARTEIGRAHV